MAKISKKSRRVKKKQEVVLSRKYNQIVGISFVVFIVLFGSIYFIEEYDVTGFSSTNRTNGTVQILVSGEAGVQLTDSLINFGICSIPNPTGLNITSNSTVSPSECTSGGYPDYMTVRNVGSNDLNITVQSNYTATQLLGGTTPGPPELAFGVVNFSDTEGCAGITPQEDLNLEFREFSAAETDYILCDNLSSTSSQRVNVSMQMHVPSDATEDSEYLQAAIQFTATNTL